MSKDSLTKKTMLILERVSLELFVIMDQICDNTMRRGCYQNFLSFTSNKQLQRKQTTALDVVCNNDNTKKLVFDHLNGVDQVIHEW